MKARGFTLLELMLAMAIFAVIATGSYMMLSNFIDAKERTEKHAMRLAQLQRAMLILEHDFEQVAARPIRDEFDEVAPAIMGMPNGTVEFTRNGWANPAGSLRSDLQRVRYDFEQGKLWRSSWQVLDRAPDSKPQRVVILTGVLEFAVKFYPLEKPRNTVQGGQAVIGEPVETWPPPSADEISTKNRADLPKLVDINVNLEDFGDIHRQFVLVDYDPKAQDPTANSFTLPGVSNNHANEAPSSDADSNSTESN